MPIFGLLGGLLRKKPEVPKFRPIDTGAEAGKAVQANATNFGDISGLASRVNEFNTEELQAALKQIIPNIDSINQRASSNIESMLAGEIPDDVAEAVNRASASSSFARGLGGSGFGRNLRTRDLGLTSLQLTQQGLDSASKWLSNARQTQVAPQMDVTSMFISPALQIQTAWQNEQARMTNEWNRAQVNSQFSFGTQAANALGGLDSIAGTAGAIGLGNWFSRQLGG